MRFSPPRIAGVASVVVTLAAALVVALAVPLTSLRAQQSTTPPPSPSAPPPSAAQMTLSTELLQLLHMDAALKQMGEAMIDQQAQNPMFAPFRDVMKQWASKYLTADAFRADFTTLYASTFTEQELKDLVAFYKTPTGQKFALKQGELATAGAKVGQRIANQHAAELQQLIEARAKELGAGEEE